jgi:hypothetical protein
MSRNTIIVKYQILFSPTAFHLEAQKSKEKKICGF